MPADPYTASVFIEAEPERVFGYFTRPEALTAWMGRRASLDPRPGGEFALDFLRVNVRGHYVEVDPPRRLVITWGHEGSPILPPGASTLEVTFAGQSNGTLVQVVHRDLPEVEAPRHALGWDHFMRRLAVVAAGGDPGPDPWRNSPPPLAMSPWVSNN